MTIAQLVQHFRPGGLETMALSLGEQLSQSQPVIYLSLEGQTKQLQQQWPRLKTLPHLYGLNKSAGVDWRLPLRLHRLLQRHQVTHLHSHHQGPLLYGALATRFSGIGHVHSHHDGWHLQQRHAARLTRWVQRFRQPYSVAVAEQVAEQLRQQGCEVDSVIANGVDLQRFSPGDQGHARWRLGLPQAPWLFGSVARLVAIKRLHLLIEALPRLPHFCELVLVGDGPCREALQERAQQLGVMNRVHFLGHTDEPEWVYRALDRFCLCSKAEGAPMAMWEAQGCDLPVICTDVGNCRANLCPVSGTLVTVDADWALTLQQALAVPRATARAFAVAQGGLATMAQAYQRLFALPPTTLSVTQ